MTIVFLSDAPSYNATKSQKLWTKGLRAEPSRAARERYIVEASLRDAPKVRMVASMACACISKYRGMATAARMPRTTIMIINSIKVNPLDIKFLSGSAGDAVISFCY